MKFQVGDKVVPINKTVIGYGSLDKSKNWREAKEKGQGFLFVSKYDEEVDVYVCSYKKNARYGDYFNEMDLKKYKDKPTKNQRIAALESVVKDLEQKIIDIRNDYRYDLKQAETRIKMLEFKLEEQTKLIPPTIQSVEEIIEFEGNRYRKVDREARDGDVVKFSENLLGTTMNKHYKVHTGVKYYDNDNDLLDVYGWDEEPVVTVYELIVQPKSVNQQRAEIIEKAKKFVEVKSECVKDSPNVKGGIVRKKIENPNFYNYAAVEVEFIINQEKRTVVSLVKFNDGRIMTKDIAKCNPSDVFNEHIGKAIALGRALGLDVSEFEQAVQPTIAVGQLLKSKMDTVYKVFTLDKVDGNVKYKAENGTWRDAIGGDLPNETWYTIINDTNAIYGEVK